MKIRRMLPGSGTESKKWRFHPFFLPVKLCFLALLGVASCLGSLACREKPAAASAEPTQPREAAGKVEIDRELEYLTAVLSRAATDDDEQSRPLLFSDLIHGAEISAESTERLRRGELDYIEDGEGAYVDPIKRLEAAEDLIGKISLSRELPSTIGRLHTIPAKELDGAIAKIGEETHSAQEWWEAFARRFPEHRGILTFSRIGFSKDGTVAVFSRDLSTGPLGGDYGTFFAIKLADGSWLTVAELRGTRVFS